MAKMSRMMPPTPGGRSLVGLHRRGMVVALDLHGHGHAAADVHDAGVLARALQHVVALGGEALQQRLGVLVAAVLAPHEREDGQLHVGGLPALDRADAVVLPAGQTQLLVELSHRSDSRRVGASRRVRRRRVRAGRRSAAPRRGRRRLQSGPQPGISRQSSWLWHTRHTQVSGR